MGGYQAMLDAYASRGSAHGPSQEQDAGSNISNGAGLGSEPAEESAAGLWRWLQPGHGPVRENNGDSSGLVLYDGIYAVPVFIGADV